MRGRAFSLLLCAVAVFGCGDSGDGAGTTATAPPKQAGPLNITRPSEEDKVRAEDEGGRLVVRKDVRGLGDPGTTVVVNGGCNIDGCVVHGTTGEDGRWAATVQLDAPASEPSARIAVYYQGSPVVGPSDEVSVRLVAPKRDRPRGGGGGSGDDGGPDVPVPPSDLDPDPTPSRSGPGTLVLVGDSLGVGIEDLLPGMLPSWSITSDVKTSRFMDTGMEILSGMRVPDGSVIAISLFTNDDPTRLGALDQAVRTTVRRAGPNGCAVWATIARPPFNGHTYAGANAVLRRLDGELGDHLVLVPWAELAPRSGWLASDQVHATPEGYRQRARLYAAAARSCG